MWGWCDLYVCYWFAYNDCNFLSTFEMRIEKSKIWWSILEIAMALRKIAYNDYLAYKFLNVLIAVDDSRCYEKVINM